MPNTEPIAGHGALVAFTKDISDAATHTYTTIGQLVSSIDLETTRPDSEITPHNASVDFYLDGPILKRGARQIEINYIQGDEATHDALKEAFHTGLKIGWRTRGPGGSSGNDETIESGKLSSFKEMNPPGGPVRKVQVTFRPSGPYYVDGVLYS